MCLPPQEPEKKPRRAHDDGAFSLAYAVYARFLDKPQVTNDTAPVDERCGTWNGSLLILATLATFGAVGILFALAYLGDHAVQPSYGVGR